MRNKTKYSKEVVQEILDAIAKNKSIESVYESNPERYPTKSLVSKWIERKPEFREKVIEARRIGINSLADDLNKQLENQPKPENYDLGDRYEKIKYEADLKAWIERRKALEFMIVRLAPVFNNDFKIEKSVKVKAEVEAKVNQSNVYTIDWNSVDTTKLLPNS